MSQYLFVYGTLRPGHAPDEIASVVGTLRRVGRGHLRGKLYDLGDYPGAVLDPSSGTEIAGEVFALPDNPAALSQLDAYEGYDPGMPDGSLFVRKRRDVTLTDGRKLDCWVYIYNRDPGSAPLVSGGDYAKFKAA